MTAAAMPKMPERLLTVVEVARQAGVSVDSVRRYCDAGHLRYTRTPGGHRRIDPGDARALAERMTLPPRT